jgi:hypothetical protein
MNFTEPIFIKITLAIQTCVNNYNTELHGKPTNSDVSNTRSQTEGQPHKKFLFTLSRITECSETCL